MLQEKFEDVSLTALTMEENTESQKSEQLDGERAQLLSPSSLQKGRGPADTPMLTH